MTPPVVLDADEAERVAIAEWQAERTRLACGRGYWMDDEPPAPAPQRRPSWMFWVSIVCSVINLANLGALGYLWLARPADRGSSVQVVGEPVVLHFGPSARAKPILTGHDNIDREWALVEHLYPEESSRVSDIVVSDRNEESLAWVEPCPSQVININRKHALSTHGAELGQTLAHEMMHVTQCFDGSQASYTARQREARLREIEFLEKRRAYFAQFNLPESVAQ